MKSTLCTSEQFNHLWLFFREELAIDMYILGRVARAGRTGTAHSLIGPDEISYVFDLHLFLGRPMKIVEPGVATVGRSRNIVTTSQRSCGKVMFLQVSVCSRGGKCMAPAMYAPSHTCPLSHTRPPPRRTVGKWPLRIPLECCLVWYTRCFLMYSYIVWNESLGTK